MNLAAEGDLAMVLPLPTPLGTGDNGVNFVDLQGYPSFFQDLKAAFPERLTRAPHPARAVGRSLQRQPLEVHEVGDFEASFVPTTQDFSRLDERFRISSTLWETMPMYLDWSFAVVKLRQWGTKRRVIVTQATQNMAKTLHPFALTFPTREPLKVFFPTVHLHDGTVPTRAEFDHCLYWQRDIEQPRQDTGSRVARGQGVQQMISGQQLTEHVQIEASKGLVNGALACRRRFIKGMLPNADTWV